MELVDIYDAQGRPTLDQKDILKGNTLLRAILHKETYTLAETVRTVKAFFEKE